MEKITIHTATYNRAYILGQAYESLKKQTNKNFEWIITDDGSTDETENLVRQWMKQDNGFEMIYNPLPHVGIPRALNSGVQLSRTPWFMMLDSDDYLQPETVDKVVNWLEEIKELPDFAGVGFGKCQPDGSYMKDQKPAIDPERGYVDATHIERKKYNLNMDLCEVHRTSLFKKFPFQYWETEKYAPEQLNYNEIALDGKKLRWHPDKLYVCDYLPDGQTRDDKIVKHNPMGFAMMHNQNILLASSFREKLWSASQMTALCIYAGYPGYLKKSNSMAATILSFPAGVGFAIRRKRQFAKLG